MFCFSRPWFSVNKPVGLGYHLFVPGGFTARGQAQTDRVVQTSSGAEKENLTAKRYFSTARVTQTGKMVQNTGRVELV